VDEDHKVAGATITHQPLPRCTAALGGHVAVQHNVWYAVDVLTAAKENELIQYLNPFFDLVSNARMSRMDKDYRYRLEEMAQEASDAAQPETKWRSRVDRWSAIPTLPLYTPTLSLDDLGG